MAADLHGRRHLLILDGEWFVGEDEAAHPLGDRQIGVYAVHRLADHLAKLRPVLDLVEVEPAAVRPAELHRPFRIRHDQPDHIGPLVPYNHRLRDFGLERQHALHLLRRDIIALVVDDDILLAVGNDDPPGLIEMPDIAGMQPAVLQDARRFAFIVPIAVHHELALHQQLAILGNLHFGVHQGRTDRFHTNACARPITADDRCRFGLAITL